MKVAELYSSTAFRLAAAFGSLFAVTVVGLFAILYIQTGIALEERLRSRLNNGRSEFLRVDKRDGFNELASLVADESSVVQDNEFYLLTGSEGDFVAGNVRRAARFEGTKWINGAEITPLKGRPALQDRYLAQWVPVSGGALLYGLSDGEIRQTRHVLLRALGWGLAGTLLFAVAAGLFLGQRAQQRIDRVSNTLTAIRQGRLAARVPIEGGGGDLDIVGAQINATLDQLQRLFESVNQSSADIAHDLKTPIGRLRQRLETLHESSGSLAENRPAIEAALADIDSIVSTFEGLLNIAQIEAGARKSRFTRVDLAEIAESVAEAYAPVAEDAGMSLAFGTSPPISPTIRGDRDLLSRLIANLIENAIRHCQRGTRIAIGLGDLKGRLQLTCADNGPGIPAAEREKVFRRLYRLEKSRTTPGSGLGLALVKAIADLHEAQVRLEDNHPGLRVEVDFSGRA
jgi:signal transduction histidine kinase